MEAENAKSIRSIRIETTMVRAVIALEKGHLADVADSYR